jgi:hypothetical protein
MVGIATDTDIPNATSQARDRNRCGVMKLGPESEKKTIIETHRNYGCGMIGI